VGNGISRTDVPQHRMYEQNTLSAVIPKTTSVFTTRAVRNTSIITASSSDQFPTYNFKLTDLSNHSDLESVFEQYKIDAIRMTIRSLNASFGLYTNSTTSLADIYSVIDYNDSTAFGATADAREYENCMTLMPGESCVRVFKPKAALAAYDGTFTGYASALNSWIDTTSNAVQFYGVKLAIGHDSVGQTTHQQWEIEFEYFVSFRSVH
jgi:hypothetical protein